MKQWKRIINLIFGLILTIALLWPQSLVAQTTASSPAPTGKTMDDYIRERGFYKPNGTVRKAAIEQNRANFDAVRDYAVKFAPKAGADPALVVWWTMIETEAPYDTYKYNNCVNQTNYAPDYVCGSDNWQIAWGQQFSVAYSQLVNAFTAVYGNPNDKQKVQQVIQAVLDKSGVGGKAPNTFTVSDLQQGARSGEARQWALMLSRDPGISVYLLGTALVTINRAEVLGYGYSEADWQAYSNGLNDVLEAWGTAGTPGSNASGSGNFGPTEPPIKLEVPDCPGITREINAYNLPPSIYPKPSCGGGTPGAGVTGPTGVCTTDENVQAYGTSEKAPPEGSIFWTILGAKNGAITQGFGPTEWAMSTGMYSNYDTTLGVTGHPGVDIDAEIGDKLYIPVGGKVIIDGGTQYFYDSNKGAGTPYTGELRVELANGDQIIYGHLSKIDVRVGDTVTGGQYVGQVGSNNGPHMHMEYRKAGASTSSGYKALDPRDVFGCVSPTQSSTPNAPSVSPTTTAQVQGVTKAGGQVLAEVSIAQNFAQFQDKYGFVTPDGSSPVDFDKYSSNIATLRDFAVKWAPKFMLEPEMVVMWSLSETLPPYDSWTYSHCESLGGSIGPGETCPNSNWQIGYGQQWSTYPSLGTAFKDVYGADDPQKVQQVMQNVITKSGLSNQAPAVTAASLAASGDRFWTMILGRDQEISAYLVAQEIAGDSEYAKSLGYPNLFAHACANWGAGYCPGDGYFQTLSNTMNDVLLHWGIAGSGISGDVCLVGIPTSTSTCSSEPDNLNGLTVEQFVSKINQNLTAYKKIAECANVPWEMMAAIHLRETGLDPNYRGNNGGSWQLDPPPAGVNQFNFEEAGCYAAKLLASKIEQQFGGDGLKALSKAMDPAQKDDEYAIKAAFFGYNGTGGWQGNTAKGCTPGVDGHEKWNWDCSAYVMNQMDSNHKDMCIVGSIDGGSTNTYCDGNDGAWKVYYKLVFSTFDASGKLLVYGGRCTIGNAVINGMSLPTKSGKSINSNFWQGGHIGIDIGNSIGDPVFAIADGEIVQGGWTDGTGYYAILHIKADATHKEKWVYYGHLAAEGLVEPKNGPVKVIAGQQIGSTGDTTVKDPAGNTKPNGITTGPHLHFDIRLTQNEGQDPSQHVNPCSIDIFKNGYPSLQCTTYGSQGVSW